ncbi:MULTISPECIES: TetR/AcrR family transcriptional regulator [unclassified Ruminococcus]|uniref:TetR/AcrR family transcriptional regulator n=1 Tax=unclassified Ruminococcus TaxID=2608920 RepID=UPI00210B896A|nr:MULTISPECIES: TetR/AcrR family transcriptional regulator [unclassified Ruminococcus]MCQ4023257.1 TetR family transcriptional regulator [Ruminococcus sp. zg-924]MCQ4115042.1 TetR family transcriptional regulator [Ruminococcus sp. zg-921]
MPPKFKFTREQIIDAALEVTRKNGFEGLTARKLAAELGSSAKPIFGLFQNMEEVQSEVITAANMIYQSCIQKSLKSSEYTPYKATGMAYIRFAGEEKELFKLLFMRDRTNEKKEENREEIRPILNIIMKNLCFTEEEAYLFHIELWIFVHGIATMIATNYLEWDVDFIDKALTDAYEGLKHRYTGEK